MAEYIVPILSPPTDVQNSLHFRNIVKDLVLDKNDMLASFAVTLLFTCVPFDKVCSVVGEQINLDAKSYITDRTQPPVDSLVDPKLPYLYS